MATARRLSPLLHAAGAAVLLVVLLRPLLFGGYQRGADFWTHYWYLWHQTEAIKDGGPSLFLHDVGSAFLPRYAFYGGTLYALTGGLGVALGSALHAYQLTFLLAAGAAYGGWWWLGRQAGLSRLVAHAPAVVSVTAAYSITLLNPRSDWPEYVGVSVVPLLAASALGVLRADRLRLLPAVALVLSAVLFAGSHNLSLLCGTALLAVVAVPALVCIPQARRLVTVRGLMRVAVLLVPALLVDAWYLLPDITYQEHTVIARRRDEWELWLRLYRPLVDVPRIFTLSRKDLDIPVLGGYGSFALPVLAMGWTVVAVVAAGRPRLSDPWLRLVLILALVTAGTLWAMTHVDLLTGPFVNLQYSFRLESFVNLGVSGAVLAALVLLRDRPAPVRNVCLSVLAVVLAISVVQAARQVVDPRDTSRSTDLTSTASYYTPNGVTHATDYGAGDLPAIDVTGMPQLVFPPAQIRDGRVAGQVEADLDATVLTSVVSVPQLVRWTGAHPVAIDGKGHTVVQIDSRANNGLVDVAVEEADPAPVRQGRLLSLLGLAALGAVAVAGAAGWWRRRRRARGSSDAGDAAAVDEPAVPAVTA